ncbi:hypothetical protein L6E12_12995 [Actinokineospora sp. PR83]|uniref:hypothetical protein n=1 Tax=Actinokineospora sp. PR83 TaxID=2884908 RepID=UPI001F23BE90|nr:hypothetical protein [Actinokineospora sp. PR83]MCG8916709.1 hypothetical protein [Actinokineospora sp. PR83]
MRFFIDHNLSPRLIPDVAALNREHAFSCVRMKVWQFILPALVSRTQCAYLFKAVPHQREQRVRPIPLRLV